MLAEAMQIAAMRRPPRAHARWSDPLYDCYMHVIIWVYFQPMQALFDLEATNSELKADLRDLYITGAREVDVHGTNRKSIVVNVSGGGACCGPNAELSPGNGWHGCRGCSRPHVHAPES